MTEWRRIPGYSRYSVSDDGQVRRDVRIYRTPPGACALSPSGGYPAVSLTGDEGRSRRLHIHSLLMLAFVGPRPAGMHVCHADGDSANCVLHNLRYDTPAGNVADAIKHGTQVRGVAVVQALLDDAKVERIVNALDAGATYIELGATYGVTNYCIYRIAAGKTWRHVTGGKDRRNGYKFNSRGGLAAKAKRQAVREAT